MMEKRKLDEAVDRSLEEQYIYLIQSYISCENLEKHTDLMAGKQEDKLQATLEIFQSCYRLKY